MSKLTIIRGLPGSGKTTKAHEISNATGAIIIEPDMFLVRSGKYDWSKERVKAAHNNARKFLASCATFDCDVIYVATMPTSNDVWQIVDIFDMYQNDADLEVISMPCDMETSKARNIHNVPSEVIESMARRWENDVKPRHLGFPYND